MRTTIDLDAIALDVLRDLAVAEKRSIGKVANELILESIRNRQAKATRLRNGIPLLDREPGVIVTNELVQRIREQECV